MEPSNTGTLTGGPSVDRRAFLRIGGTAAVTTYVWLSPHARRITTALAAAPAMPAPPLSHVARLRRRDDFLALDLRFHNLVPDFTTDPDHPVLVRANPAAKAFVVAELQPQHLVEQAFFEDSTGPEPVSDPPIKARLSGASRLAFEVPAHIASIPYDTASLLEWENFTPLVVPAALPPGPAPADRTGLDLRPPEPLETAIELPWWLLLSPHADSAWAHARTAVTHAGRTELWHTRLATNAGGVVDEEDADNRTVRPIWALDPKFADYLQHPGAAANRPADRLDCPYPVGEEGVPFRMPVVPRDRFDIVTSSADYVGHVADTAYEPQPVKVRQLMLTALGAWIDAQGDWDTTLSETDLLQWRHRGTHGRDHFVRIVREGYLMPFGHRAAFISITERRFFPHNGQRPAFTFESYYIVIKDRSKAYAAFGMQDEGRGVPFTGVDALTISTPKLDDPFAATGCPDPDSDPTNSFVPHVAGQPFRFRYRATDHAGETTDFSLPTIFVFGQEATASGPANTAIDQWNASPDLNLVELGGDRVSIAPPLDPGDTAVEVTSIRMHAEGPADPATPDQEFKNNKQPRFYPAMHEASVRIAAAEQTAGADIGDTTITYDGLYRTDGLDSPDNLGRVFALIQDAPKLTFGSSDRSGGVVTPDFAMTALSRSLGPVGGNPAMAQAGTLDPADVFGAALDGAKILGGLVLSAILKDAPLDGDVVDGKALAITYRTITDPEPPGLPIALETKLEWHPEVQADPANIFVPNGQTTFDLVAITTTDLVDPAASSYSIVGDLQDFAVTLLGDVAPAITLRFDRLRFTSATGAGSDIDVQIREVEFVGVLAFVEEFRDFLGSISDIFQLDVQPSGVTARVNIPLPAIEVGVFALTNVSVSAGLSLPFTGDPARVRFAFSSREDPFSLTVSMFGGGGFFGVALGVDGMELLEAALEFGAAASINLGVASGAVEIKAGIYFKLEVVEGQEQAWLTGYVRMHGELSVLGLISLALTFEMGLTYDFTNDKAIGQATLTVEVEVAFFSTSVELTVERKFGGSNDPFFHELMTEDDWDVYAAAFAPVEVAA